MTSERQARANQQNALKSTGPRTPEGKAAVRHNAVKHGLLAEELLIPGEDEAAFADLGERLRDELQPVGELENMLVNRIVLTSWRLRRVGRVEASMFAWERYTELLERNREEARGYVRNQAQEDLYDYIGTSRESEIKDKEKLRDVVERTDELKRMQHADNTTLGRTFIRDADKANAFSKLSRYETAIERSLYKALHELQRLQAARRAEGNVSPPLAIDVDLTSAPGEDL